MQYKVNINDRSVETAGITTDYKQAISEYIWNSFDAKASEVEINYSATAIGHIENFAISDNGTGIDISNLDKTFGSFLDSVKKDTYQRSSFVHGKKGKGRYSFINFAQKAIWNTIFRYNGNLLEYEISINRENKDYYFCDKEKQKISKKEKTGTIVKFENVIELTGDLINTEDFNNFLAKNFGWFLHLNKSRNYFLKINGQNINYEYLIADTETNSITIKNSISGIENEFEITYVRWTEKIGDKYFFYLLNEEKIENTKVHTSLNNKDNEFHHSVYIISTYFNDFVFEKEQTLRFSGKNQTDNVFKQLIKYLKTYLEEKEKEFLRGQGAIKLIEYYEKQNIIPTFRNTLYDRIRKQDLIDTIKEIYFVQPKIFKDLSKDQSKTMVGFLNLLLDTEERENIVTILDSVIKLNSEERQNLVSILKVTSLSKIANLLKLIEERYRTFHSLKKLVLEKDLKANERDHLQEFVENAYWIFGEKYNLVTAEEPDFEEALRKFNYILKGEDKKKKIEHPDKNKEMDVFACRRNIYTDRIENVVIELKHPKITLGEKELSQVKKYMDVILSEDDFNAPNMSWDFLLIGNDYNKYIEREISTNKFHGEKSLVFSIIEPIQYKIYVKKWSEIFAEFEIRHDYINKTLRLQRDKLITKLNNPNEIVESVINENTIMN